jgi:tRNA A37 methylthiotransferase MiaB
MALIVKGQIKAYNPNILVLSCPLTDTNQPMHAGAVLKSIANKAGFSCTTVDLNALTVKWILTTSQNAKKFPGAFLDASTIRSYFWNGHVTHQTQECIDKFTVMVLEIITKYQPKILALSVFTDHSRTAVKLISQIVRQHFPDIKIIIGGAGIVNPDAEDSFYHPVAQPGQISFAEKLLQNNQIDFYIQGDAEHAFLEFLKGNQDFVGINQPTWRQLTNSDLVDLEYPDYSDYNWSLYEETTIGITGSRGCVRQCRFCDYIDTWKKYTWRTGENIFNEMLYQKKRYNINFFHFSDSLLNGNMAEYRNLVTLLAEYNAANPNSPFKWGSMLIIKSPAQFDDELWRLTAASGCAFVWIGLETLVEQVRFDMNKKFTNQDIEFCIEKIIKYNITTAFLLFVGYPTETQEHIEQSIQWLKDHQHQNGHFTLFFNETMNLLTGSWLDKNKHVYQIKLIDVTNGYTWESPESNLALRKQRAKLLIDTARSLGYQVFLQDMDFDALQ